MDSKESKDKLSDYEYSFMLLAILYSRRNFLELLSFLPSESSERIKEEAGKFLSLRQNDRILKIIYEIKRLLDNSQKA